MFTQTMTAEQVLEIYKDDVYKLSEYIPWLVDKSGKSVSSVYTQDGVGTNSVSFPVYDSTLMAFIKTAENTAFMDRNYKYVYTRNRISNYKDELKIIRECTILQMDILGGILSKYILGGRTKSTYWREGMDYGVFCEVILKAKELVDFWVNATTVMSDEEARA